MRYLKYLALLAVLMIPLAYSQAQIGVSIGVGSGYYGGPPVCTYGYYGPNWFVGGVFIGARPWYGGYYGRGGWWPGGYYRGGYYGRRGYGYARGSYGRVAYGGRGYAGGGYRASAGRFHGGGGRR